MEIICRRRCFDAEGNQYVIGGKYKWYNTDYVFMVPYNEKLYNIYLEASGIDVFMGTGTIQFIEFNFEPINTSEFEVIKCVCINTIVGPNGRKYKENEHYKYSLKEVKYAFGEEQMYVMYSDSGVWMSYVKKEFLKNFMDYSLYINEWLEVDELFDNILSK